MSNKSLQPNQQQPGMRNPKKYQPPGTNLRVSTPGPHANMRRARVPFLKSSG